VWPNVSIAWVTALIMDHRHQAVISVVHILSGIQPTSKPRVLVSAVVFSVIAIWMGAIPVKEFVEGHVSTSRSWWTSVVLIGLALLAAWRAARSWRKVRETR
jgi:predicted tellurium resistance membrane protein TerC